MKPLKNATQRIFGQDALNWTDRAYIIDWVLIVCVWLLAWAASFLPVFERNFNPNDPLISYPHGKDQVSSTLNHNIAFWIPIISVVVVGALRRSLVEIHHGAIAICAGSALANLVTVLVKHRVGRLRPDFLARCKWDVVLLTCTGKPSDISSGRKSFPSGHSSTAFAGMTFLALWLAGKTAAWCFHAKRPSASLRSSLLGSFLLTILPLSWASFVAISRIEDYRHHKEDVVVGSIIGIISATISYLIFWPNPFPARNFTADLSTQPRFLYVPCERGRPDMDFELTRLEEDIENV